jgi:hypothetical protein
MKFDTICPVCHRLDEDVAHIYLKCKEVKKLWPGLCMEDERTQLAMFKSSKEALEEFILSLSEKKMMTCIIVLWTWWTERNRIREGERGRTTKTLVHNIQAYGAEIQKGVHSAHQSCQECKNQMGQASSRYAKAQL